MKIHLLRHADAENFASNDAARALTEKGQSQAAQVGDFLERNGVKLNAILTSPYLRALQTAEAVARKYKDASFLEESRLVCGFSPETGLAIIQEYRKLEHVLIVGHQPDLGILSAYLLTVDGSINLEFKKASLLTISLLKLNPGAGFLESYVTVKQMLSGSSS